MTSQDFGSIGKVFESMTRQITDQLGSLISSGAMAVGSLLPSERSLANSLGVARNVVRAAMNIWKSRRRPARRKKGKGAYARRLHERKPRPLRQQRRPLGSVRSRASALSIDYTA